MKYCKYCGKENFDGDDVCEECKNNHNTASDNTSQKINDFFSKAQKFVDNAANDEKNSNQLAFLSYLGLLIIIPLILSEKNKFLKFHVNQGLVLLIVRYAGFFILKIPSMIFFPIIGWLPFAFMLLTFIINIYMLIESLRGKMTKMPLFGNITIIK